jgi:hypothetical protein
MLVVLRGVNSTGDDGSKLPDVISKRGNAKTNPRLLPIMSFRDAEPANLVLQSRALQSEPLSCSPVTC